MPFFFLSLHALSFFFLSWPAPLLAALPNSAVAWLRRSRPLQVKLVAEMEGALSGRAGACAGAADGGATPAAAAGAGPQAPLSVASNPLWEINSTGGSNPLFRWGGGGGCTHAACTCAPAAPQGVPLAALRPGQPLPLAQCRSRLASPSSQSTDPHPGRAWAWVAASCTTPLSLTSTPTLNLAMIYNPSPHPSPTG